MEFFYFLLRNFNEQFINLFFKKIVSNWYQITQNFNLAILEIKFQNCLILLNLNYLSCFFILFDWNFLSDLDLNLFNLKCFRFCIHFPNFLDLICLNILLFTILCFVMHSERYYKHVASFLNKLLLMIFFFF